MIASLRAAQVQVQVLHALLVQVQRLEEEVGQAELGTAEARQIQQLAFHCTHQISEVWFGNFASKFQCLSVAAT